MAQGRRPGWRPELALRGARAGVYSPGMDYASKRCVPCEGGAPALAPAQVEAALRSLRGWEAKERHTRLQKQLRFPDFKEAMRFVNALADLAEAEGHHPDFAVHYGTVDVTLWTHAVGGLTENDLILAAKLDRLAPRDP
jgi:4a-hydroxytetrahydrobiopterin dehydratase